MIQSVSNSDFTDIGEIVQLQEVGYSEVFDQVLQRCYRGEIDNEKLKEIIESCETVSKSQFMQAFYSEHFDSNNLKRLAERCVEPLSEEDVQPFWAREDLSTELLSTLTKLMPSCGSEIIRRIFQYKNFVGQPDLITATSEIIEKTTEIQDEAFSFILSQNPPTSLLFKMIPKLDHLPKESCERAFAFLISYSEAVMTAVVDRAIQLDPEVDLSGCMYYLLYARTLQSSAISERASPGEMGGEPERTIYSEPFIEKCVRQSKQLEARSVSDIVGLGLQDSIVALAIEKSPPFRGETIRNLIQGNNHLSATSLGLIFRKAIREWNLAENSSVMNDTTRYMVLTALFRTNSRDLVAEYYQRGGKGMSNPKNDFSIALADNSGEEVLSVLLDRLEPGTIQPLDIQDLQEKGYSAPLIGRAKALYSSCVIM